MRETGVMTMRKMDVQTNESEGQVFQTNARDGCIDQ